MSTLFNRPSLFLVFSPGNPGFCSDRKKESVLVNAVQLQSAFKHHLLRLENDRIHLAAIQDTFF